MEDQGEGQGEERRERQGKGQGEGQGEDREAGQDRGSSVESDTDYVRLDDIQTSVGMPRPQPRPQLEDSSGIPVASHGDNEEGLPIAPPRSVSLRHSADLDPPTFPTSDPDPPTFPISDPDPPTFPTSDVEPLTSDIDPLTFPTSDIDPIMDSASAESRKGENTIATESKSSGPPLMYSVTLTQAMSGEAPPSALPEAMSGENPPSALAEDEMAAKDDVISLPQTPERGENATSTTADSAELSSGPNPTSSTVELDLDKSVRVPGPDVATPTAESDLDKSVRVPGPDTATSTVESDLDKNVRVPGPDDATSTVESDLDQSPSISISSPNKRRAGVRRTSSTNNSPILRPKSPHSPLRRPSSELAVLQPLSPEHGTQLNEQYEFLRRALSHSQRRYSQRGKRPRERKGKTAKEGALVPNGGVANEGVVNGGVANGGVASGRGTGLERALSMTTRDTRQKKTIGSLRDIVRGEGSSENSHTTQESDEDMETHVDQHGRTYYMDHNTRTIAFDRTVNPGASPRQQEIQTRREMLDRR